jgi:ribosomal protein S18 acetylase RimI-like enzyme
MEQKAYTLNDGKKIKIRELSQSDKHGLSEFYSYLNEEDFAQLHPITDKFTYPDYFINMVIEHQNRIVGYGEIQKDPLQENGYLNIFIHHEFQGAGLGTALMIMLVKEATDEGLHNIHLEVDAENTRAIHLFRKFGFQETITKKKYTHNGVREIHHMSKALSQ